MGIVVSYGFCILLFVFVGFVVALPTRIALIRHRVMYHDNRRKLLGGTLFYPHDIYCHNIFCAAPCMDTCCSWFDAEW